ncbi:MAG: hypothetical protein ABL921_30780, partial [Pirellula sp.]
MNRFLLTWLQVQIGLCAAMFVAFGILALRMQGVQSAATRNAVAWQETVLLGIRIDELRKQVPSGKRQDS